MEPLQFIYTFGVILEKITTHEELLIWDRKSRRRWGGLVAESLPSIQELLDLILGTTK